MIVESAPSPHFNLFTRDGQARFVLQYRDEGIVLESDSISVMRQGHWTQIPYEAITSVTLSAALAGRRSIAQCIIQLSNGSKLITSNSNASGLATGERDGDFRDFVTAFHRQLVASGAARRIRFISGFSQARMNVLTVTLVIAVGLFLLLPLVLLLITHDTKALVAILGGLGLLIPVWRIVKVNQPATYSPESPPDLV